jgi:multidrug efflux pump subunit AcrB
VNSRRSGLSPGGGGGLAEAEALGKMGGDAYVKIQVSQQLSKISGVSQVLVGGQQKPAIRVQIDPAKLASMGLTLEDVRSVITNATVNSPKGSIDGPDKSYTVLDDDQLTDPAPYNDIVVAWRNGAPVHIGDIGQAVRGPPNRELAGWQNGKRGVLLLAFKQPGANVIQTVERIKAALPALEASIPPTVRVNTIVDRTQVIHASVERRRVHYGPIDRAGGDGDLPVPS